MRTANWDPDDDWMGDLSDRELDALLSGRPARTPSGSQVGDGSDAAANAAAEGPLASSDADVPELPEPEVPAIREAEMARDAERVTESAADQERQERTEAAPESRAKRGRGGLIATLIGVGAIIALAAAAFGPQVARNLSTDVVAADTPLTLTNGADAATLTVPAGWHVVRPLGAGDTIALETPDGLVEFTFSLTHRPDAEAPPPAGAEHALTGTGWITESPTGATTATYARTEQPQTFEPGGLLGLDLFADGSPTHAGIVAAIVPEPARASGAVIDVVGTSDAPIEPYLGEFALIVASLEFAS